MSIEVILNCLDDVKSVGKNKYMAKCPVHGSNSRKLMVSERVDKSVGVHCFVCGANGLDLCQEIGVSSTELFPDDGYKPPVITRQMLEDEQMDRMILAMAENTPPQTLADKRRVKMAQARLEGIEEKRRHIEDTNKATQNVDNEVMPF